MKRTTQRPLSPPSRTYFAPSSLASHKDDDFKADRRRSKYCSGSCGLHIRHRKYEKRSSTPRRILGSEKSPSSSECSTHLTHNRSGKSPRLKDKELIVLCLVSNRFRIEGNYHYYLLADKSPSLNIMTVLQRVLLSGQTYYKC